MGDQGRAVTGVQAGVVGLAPGPEQRDGEEGRREKGDSLRIDRGKDNYAANNEV